VQALITDMNQPLATPSETARNHGGLADVAERRPDRPHATSLELAARMIFLGKITKHSTRLASWRKRSCSTAPDTEIQRSDSAQGAIRRCWTASSCCRTRPVRERSRSPRGGYVSAIDAEYIAKRPTSLARAATQGRRDRPGGRSDSGSQGRPKSGFGGVLCRLYYTSDEHVEEAAQMVEDAFRISATPPDERELILEVVG